MAFNRRQARTLTTRSELELVNASYPDAIGKLSTRALKSHITRARNLRDKQRDLLQRQKLATRARTGTKVGGNERTAQKAGLFDQALARFTRRLNAMQAHVSSRGRRNQARRDSR